VSDALARGVEAVRQASHAYEVPPGAPRTTTPSTPAVFGTPIVALMDLPQLSEDTPAHRPMIAAYARTWPGDLAVMRSPTEDGFTLLTSVTAPASLGALTEPLAPGPTSRFDHANSLVVDLYAGTLTSVSDTALFGGANALAIESTPGTWEILQAGRAELVGPNRYRLTRLLRGQRGTEYAMGDPAPIGARVVLLDAGLTSLPTSEADIGIPYHWRIGPARLPVLDGAYVARDFAPEAVGLHPFAPGPVAQPWQRPHEPGDLTLRWVRRSRELAADSWAGIDVPLAEDSEAYEVDILDGSTVKSTLASTTPAVTYTAAQQTADWGAPLPRGAALTIRLFQVSLRVGRGAPKTVTLTL
jgi:hypothetical protein